VYAALRFTIWGRVWTLRASEGCREIGGGDRAGYEGGEEVNMRGLSAEEQIIELRTALLWIHSRVLLLTTALDGLGKTIAEEAGRVSSAAGTAGGADSTRRESSSFQENVLLYAQRRAARRTLTQAVRAGALIPQDALGFTVEGYPPSDEGIDVLALRARAPQSGDESETEDPELDTPGAEVPTLAPMRTSPDCSAGPENLAASRQSGAVLGAGQGPTVPTSAISDVRAASVRNPRVAASPRAARHRRRVRHVFREPTVGAGSGPSLEHGSATSA
jgi:hypothetical protein